MSAGFSAGCVIERRGQTYTCVDVEPYTNRKREVIDLFVFESGCAVCGEAFRVKVVPTTKFWNQRCPACIAAGVTA